MNAAVLPHGGYGMADIRAPQLFQSLLSPLLGSGIPGGCKPGGPEPFL